MMNAEQLSRVGEKLVKRCASRSPWKWGITVLLEGKFFGENTLGKTRFYAFGTVESGSMETDAPKRYPMRK